MKNPVPAGRWPVVAAIILIVAVVGSVVMLGRHDGSGSLVGQTATAPSNTTLLIFMALFIIIVVVVAAAFYQSAIGAGNGGSFIMT